MKTYKFREDRYFWVEPIVEDRISSWKVKDKSAVKLLMVFKYTSVPILIGCFLWIFEFMQDL